MRPRKCFITLWDVYSQIYLEPLITTKELAFKLSVKVERLRFALRKLKRKGWIEWQAKPYSGFSEAGYQRAWKITEKKLEENDLIAKELI